MPLDFLIVKVDLINKFYSELQTPLAKIVFLFILGSIEVL
jgi:hypothetical protein